MQETLGKIINKTALSAILPLAVLAGTLLNVYLASKLAPLEQANAVLVTKVDALNDQVTALKAQNVAQSLDTVLQPQFKDLVDRVDHISSRVDAIYNIVATKK